MRRKPRHRGTGIYVHFQTFKDLVVGDTYFDGDWGRVIWNGSQWVEKLDRIYFVIFKDKSVFPILVKSEENLKDIIDQSIDKAEQENISSVELKEEKLHITPEYYTYVFFSWV